MRTAGFFRTLNNLLYAGSAPVTSIFIVGMNDATETASYHHQFPAATLHCFEPNPDSFDHLKKTFNAEPQVRMHWAAVSEATGKSRFHVNEPSGTSSLFEWNKASPYNTEAFTTLRTVDVQAFALDDFCRRYRVNHIDLLLMDAQGAEHLVLKGARDLLARHRIRVIGGEVMFTDRYGYAHMFYDIYGIMMGSGYEFMGLFRPTYSKAGKMYCADFAFALPQLVKAAEKRMREENGKK